MTGFLQFTAAKMRVTAMFTKVAMRQNEKTQNCNMPRLSSQDAGKFVVKIKTVVRNPARIMDPIKSRRRGQFFALCSGLQNIIPYTLGTKRI
jgi:hypothetical protein